MVMDESYVINQLKEDVSYVSTQFNIDMQIARYVYVFMLQSGVQKFLGIS